MPGVFFLLELILKDTTLIAPSLIGLDFSCKFLHVNPPKEELGRITALNLKHLKSFLTTKPSDLLTITDSALTRYSNTGIHTDCDELQRLSSESPNLEELTIIQFNTAFGQDEADTEIAQIRFDKLKYFHFGWKYPEVELAVPQENLAILDNLFTPKLILLEYRDIAGVQFSPIRVWLAASNALLDTLVLRNPEFDAGILSSLLAQTFTPGRAFVFTKKDDTEVLKVFETDIGTGDVWTASDRSKVDTGETEQEADKASMGPKD
ncbi:hypothetical protein M422DRAFT_256005 [Sphaerobolus stellatus SS14]|uniref:Uncharacterized protein n=1 Tax=Sphaerobolus stellatus (strain SS14) TaxID=990650 RepID=A0A0C9V2A7_SPHS4|nr:hypothetical protein M422DRAFT_256005 [Sphaerobolus stellatus SS14]